MPSSQSQLGDTPGIAEELAADQRSISIAEFFEKNKHMLGFDSGARAVVTAVKEAVDNALDASEEAGILPDVYVEVSEAGDYYRLVVEDNGPGITREQIPKIFGKLLYGSRFHKRVQKRGQQGIGISAAVLYAQLTSGKPAKITSRTQGSEDAEYFEVIVDTDENEPEIDAESTTTWDRPHGTRIEIEFEGNMRARRQLRDYVKHTAVVNPHARIELVEPEGSFKFERATDQLPAETEEIRPHPHGVELGTLIKMLEATDSYSVSGFLQGEFTRVGQKTAAGILDGFRDEYFGRAMTWAPPQAHDAADVEAALTAAVSNKGKRATADFASRVADRVAEFDRLSYHQTAEVIDDVAGIVEDDHDVTFGSTVRENARVAAWRQILGGDADEDVRDSLRADLYGIVDEATSSRKDDAAVEGLADRLAAKFAGSEDDRHRFTRATLADFVERSADATEEYDDVTFGETARENVLEALWSRMMSVPDEPPKVSAIADNRDAASDLLSAMRAADIIAPPTDCLSPITADLVREGLEKEYDADFYAAETRDASVHGGDPFIVEAGIAYGGDLEEESSADVLRFANRVPLVYQRGACATTDVVKSINWRNYGLNQPGGSGIPSDAVVIMVHVASTNVPFTSESKDAIANIPEIESEIELALREAARDLKAYLNKRRSIQQRREKQNKLATVLPVMAKKVAEVAGREPLDIEDTMARIMNNVLVEREREDGVVRLLVENNSGTNADLEITDIASAEPAAANGAQVTEMDGDWFISWSPTVESGDEAVLEYELDESADVEASVDGVEEAKLTVNA